MPVIEQTITILAPIDHVYQIARDVEAFPQFMADLQSLKVLEKNDDGSRTVTEWVGLIREFKMTLKWTQEDLWNFTQYRDDFRMLSGDMDRLEGYWQFSSIPEGTSFTSVLDYEYDVPLIGKLVKSLIKKKMTDNLQATLEAIKNRAESTEAT